MENYIFNPAAYTALTAHLSPIEDIICRRLIDLNYLRDDLTVLSSLFKEEDICSPVTKEYARLIRMPNYIGTVDGILNSFFGRSYSILREIRRQDSIWLRCP